MLRHILLSTFTIILAAQPCFSQVAEQKSFFAGVDLSRVIGLHPEAQKALVQLTKERDAVRAELNAEFEKYQKLVDEGRKLEEQFQSPAISDARRRELRAEGAKIIQQAREKGLELQEFRQKKIQDFTVKYQSESQKILTTIRDRINEISKDKGASLVINTSGRSRANTPVLQYLQLEFDLTEDVLKSFGIQPDAQVPDTAVLLEAEENITPYAP